MPKNLLITSATSGFGRAATQWLPLLMLTLLSACSQRAAAPAPTADATFTALSTALARWLDGAQSRWPRRRSATTGSTPSWTTFQSRAAPARSSSAAACCATSMRSTARRSVAREPGRRRHPPQPGRGRHLVARDAAVVGLGSAAVQRSRRQRDLHADGARFRAAAAATEVGHRAHGEDPGVARDGAPEPRPEARAEDPCRDRRASRTPA